MNFKTSYCTLKAAVWEQSYVWLLYYFCYERSYYVLKLKSPCILLNKNKKLTKTRWNRKWKTPQTVLERWNLIFSSYKNCKLKIKLRWVGELAKEKSRNFCNVYFVQRKFFWRMCFISMYSVFNKLLKYMCFCIAKNITLYV